MTPPRPRPAGLILTVPGAARELGFSAKKVDRLISAGLLPARRLGGKTVILRAELERFLAGLPAIATVDGALARAAARERANGRPGDTVAR